MQPLLRQMIDTLLPALVSETLGVRILEELEPFVQAAAETPVELVIAPASRAAIERHMAGIETLAVTLREEPSLAPDQAHLRLGRTEMQIDLSDALARIRAAIDALYEINERTLQHG